MYSLIRTFLREESGATSIEYGLIAAGIGVALITLVGQVGDEIQTIFSGVHSQLNSFSSGGVTQ
jgi:pilus assembly protein Flp/PilA